MTAAKVATVSDFLLARIAEDEAVARAAGAQQWTARTHDSDSGMVRDADGTVVVFDEGAPLDEEAQHIARHDPARVLAECEAKRRLIEIDARQAKDKGILAALAMPYASHPDYCDEWRP